MLDLTDFDVEVSSVLLAHRYTIAAGTGMDSYRTGRCMHGMVCALSGSAMYIFSDGERVELASGDIALIPAASAYRIETRGETDFEHYTINFLGGAQTFPDWIPQTRMHVLKPKDPARFQTRFEELVEGWRRMRVGYRMQTRARLLSLLADFLTECMTQKLDPGAYGRTLPAKRMIEARYDEPLTLRILAEACGMSEASFRRAFTSVYSQAPVQYLLKLRVEKAKELLLLGLSMEETARQTGFMDVNYFIRYFKKTTGMTPGTFRSVY